MRLLLSKDSKKKLFTYLLEHNNSSSMKQLSLKLNIPMKTLQEWRYIQERYIPHNIVPNDVREELEILDQKEDNWGKIKGGQETYKTILKKYGPEEIKKRQKNGGLKSISILRKKEEPFKINLTDPLFLEFYGILIGDGWLSKLHNKNKITYLVGISGHLTKDKDFHIYISKNILDLFNRHPYLKEIKKYNAREVLFGHKNLIKFLNEKLNFPIGHKKDLSIPKEILEKGFNSTKHVIRGVFDTDGCFYLDKTPVGRPYPCIAIAMKAPLLIKQIYDILLQQGFKVSYQNLKKSKEGQSKITLKGSLQVRKWANEIGSSNPSKNDRMKKALVAQFG